MYIKGTEYEVNVSVSSLVYQGEQVGVRFEIDGELKGIPYENMIDLEISEFKELNLNIPYNSEVSLVENGTELASPEELKSGIYAEEFSALEFSFSFGNLIEDLRNSLIRGTTTPSREQVSSKDLKDTSGFVNSTSIKVPKRYQLMLDELYKDSEGYWAYSKTGYYFPTMGCHTAHEYTQKEIVDVLKTVKPCSCRECTEELQRKSKSTIS